MEWNGRERFTFFILTFPLVSDSFTLSLSIIYSLSLSLAHSLREKEKIEKVNSVERIGFFLSKMSVFFNPNKPGKIRTQKREKGKNKREEEERKRERNREERERKKREKGIKSLFLKTDPHSLGTFIRFLEFNECDLYSGRIARDRERRRRRKFNRNEY